MIELVKLLGVYALIFLVGCAVAWIGIWADSVHSPVNRRFTLINPDLISPRACANAKLMETEQTGQVQQPAGGLAGAPYSDKSPSIEPHYHCNRCGRPVRGIRQFPDSDVRSWCSVCAPGVVR